MIKKTCFTGSKFEIKVILNRYRVRRKAVTKTSEKKRITIPNIQRNMSGLYMYICSASNRTGTSEEVTNNVDVYFFFQKYRYLFTIYKEVKPQY